jgi:hypothetical protein
MIGICEQNIRARTFERFDHLAANRRLSADRHENRRLDFSMERTKARRASVRVGGLFFEFKLEAHNRGPTVLAQSQDFRKGLLTRHGVPYRTVRP